MKIKEFIITIFFILTLLVIYGFFPAKNIFQQFIIMFVFFVVIPIIFNKFFLKRKAGDVGINIGNWKQGLIWGGISIIFAGIVFFIAIYFFDFLKKYPIQNIITQNYKNFLFYEFVYVLPVILMYDFFFRGFIMLTIRTKIYYWAIVIQAVLFFMLIITTKSLSPAIIPYMITAPLAGIIIYKSKSIFYSTTFQFIIISILDASIVRLIK